MHTPSLTVPSMRLRAPWASLRIKRRTILILTAALVTSAAAFGWPRLVAAGVAPFILALAPCAAVCAAGVCMKGMGSSCSTTAVPNDHAGRSETPVSATHGQPS